MKGKLVRRNGELRIVWDDPIQGLTNCSLPIHPDDLQKDHPFDRDDLSHLKLNEGDEVEFTHVTYNDIYGWKDVAKIISHAK